MSDDPRPYLRWWWFSGPLSEGDIDEQLEWIAAKGFGGVEIAWVYPLPGAEAGPRFLDAEWRRYVRYAVERCAALGLGCDLTFGTLWPFGGSFVPRRYASATVAGPSPQRLTSSWESGYREEPGLVLDHLEAEAVAFYADHLLDHGFREFAGMRPLSFFCDSWEVEGEELATAGLFEDFSSRFGYDLRTRLPELARDTELRFDYRLCLSDRVLGHFYSAFSAACREAGAASRVQCHGAPTDVLAAYALADIPETETMLFDPGFASLAASAAAVRGKPLVSSESFTCLYGWVPKPGIPPGIGEERVEDLRCVADAQFAWGVNRVVWHGKPYGTRGRPNRFYATVHVGPDGSLDEALLPFNRYLGQTSAYLAKGRTYSRMALYFPLEDQWMRDELPGELVKPSSHHHWELQEVRMPEELLPWRPLWFSGKWLEELDFDGELLRCGAQSFGIFYCDAEWMQLGHLERLAALARRGAPIHFERAPREPGLAKHERYGELLDELLALERGRSGPCPLERVAPILSSELPLDFWCREDGSTYYLFVSHPMMRGLRYPLPIGYHERVRPVTIPATFRSPRNEYPLELAFGAARSLLYAIQDERRRVELIDCDSRGAAP